MMDARPCPDAALLAAFLDGALPDYERAAVVSHLADCPACRAVAVTVVEFREVEALDSLWEHAAPAPQDPLFTGRVTLWSRARTRAPALVAAAVLIAALVPSGYRLSHYFNPSSSPQQALTTLMQAAEGQRPVEGRLSGESRYAPPPFSSSTPRVEDRARIQLVATAANVRRTYANDYNTPSRRAVGVAALLVGDVDEAIATLEIASAGAPHDTDLANDLAAAYFERAQRANRPDDLPAALSAVERVLFRDPANREALFNRALIITALGLRTDAEAAWQAYIARDSDSPWTVEARQRLASLRSAVRVGDWPTLRASIESGASEDDADVAVRHHASAARQYVETDLLKRWVAAAKAGDPQAEAGARAQLKVFSDAFVRVASDRTYRDFLDTVGQAQSQAAKSQLVQAHEEYLAAMALMAQQRFVEAAPVLQRAERQLAATRSPFSLRAQIEHAATHYFALRYRDAAAILTQVERVAAERHHVIYVTRATWLLGMAAYGIQDFAAAEAAYARMLASAAAAGDVDQWIEANVLLANLYDTLGDGRRSWRHRVDAAGRLDDVFARSTRARFLVSASGDSLAGEHHATALLFQSLLAADASGVAPSVEVQVRSQRALTFYRLGRRSDANAELALARSRLAVVSAVASRLHVEADVLAVEAEVWSEHDRSRARAAVERLVTLPVLGTDHLRRARAHLQWANLLFAEGDLAASERAIAQGFTALEAFQAAPSAEFAIRDSDPVWGLYRTAARVALRRGDLATAFEQTERGRMRTVQDRQVWGKQIATLSEAQRSLKSDTALVMLSQLEDELHVWVLRADRVTTNTLQLSRSRAAGLVATQLHEMMTGAASPMGSAELFDAVIRPIEATLAGAQQLVVVADAPYSRIAFAGLWDRRRNRYVVERHGVLLAPNATAFVNAAARPAPGAKPPAAQRASFVGAPSGGRATIIADSLSSVYGPRMTRAAASAASFSENVALNDVVHVSAPVFHNREFPGLSHLALSGDSEHLAAESIFARNVGQSPPRARLVALESGTRVEMTALADGSSAFATALLASGVDNVVSSVANVEPGALEQTWMDFHRHYAAGNAAADSLRRAQLAALVESEHRPGPWATLTVFGAAQ